MSGCSEDWASGCLDDSFVGCLADWTIGGSLARPLRQGRTAHVSRGHWLARIASVWTWGHWLAHSPEGTVGSTSMFCC